MTPQVILTALLVLLTITGLVGVATEKHASRPEAIAAGRAVGVLLRYGTIFLLLWLGGFYDVAEAATVPHAAQKHRHDLTRHARLVWGLDAPVADFAGQLHQESSWRPDVVSRAGAEGLAQFLPGTAAWMAQLYPSELGEAAPLTPAWSLRAMLRYDRHLWERITAVDDCHRLAFTLSAYNGGLGWVYRDKSSAEQAGEDRNRYWAGVEKYNAGRSAENWHENRTYPKRILYHHAPLYHRAGWGRRTCS